MNLRFLTIALFFSMTVTLNVSAQGGQLDSDYFMIGSKRIFTNMQGQTSPSNENLIPNLKEKALLSYSSDHSFGFSFETLNQFRRNNKWHFVGALGFYQVGGQVNYKKLTGRVLSGNDEYWKEFERHTQFKSSYLYASTKFSYTFLPKQNISFLFGPTIAGRIINQQTSHTSSYVHEHKFDPNLSEWVKENTSNDQELVPLQLFMSMGVYKNFSFFKRKIMVGFEYERSFLNLHNVGDLKSHMMSVSIKYAWFKN